MKTLLTLSVGFIFVLVSQANVWDDCAARYGGRVDGAATGTFTRGSLLDSRHGVNASAAVMADVRDWHESKGGGARSLSAPKT